MQTMTSTYAPGRSPFARLMRNTRRQVANMRAWEQASREQEKHSSFDLRYAYEHQDDPFLAACLRAEATVDRFDEFMTETYGADRAARIYEIANRFA